MESLISLCTIIGACVVTVATIGSAIVAGQAVSIWLRRPRADMTRSVVFPSKPLFIPPINRLRR